ncbi:hypothetical protein IKF84_00535 [Candidatus Saccharibacteria bacterium]|nr:hypothetical protein [Candidatus Saccharibacteria bacterium]
MFYTWQCPAFGADEKRGTSGGECYGTYSDTTGGSGPGYTNSCIHSGSNDYTSGNTVWYNYGTATAGTITGTDNTIIATESICPKGWSLPNKKQIDIIGGASPGSSTYVSNFSPVLGGDYGNGTLYNKSTHGLWWGSTALNGALRYSVYYDASSLYTRSGGRVSGVYIRCVSEEKDVSDLTYMQDMTAKVVESPKGWTLPSVEQSRSIGPDAGSATYVSAFSPVLGGYYANGTFYDGSVYGYWWGSISRNGAVRYVLSYNGSILYNNNRGRNYGFYIRCIQAS